MPTTARSPLRRLALLSSNLRMGCGAHSTAAAPAATCLALPRLPLRYASPVPPTEPPRGGYHDYQLLASERLTPDTRLLRFAGRLGAAPPSCVKVRQAVGQPGGAVVLDKSYSPVSFPDEDCFELLVKAYPPRPAEHPPIHGGAGGLGKWLTELTPGDSASMEIKAPRLFHGEPYAANRWRELGFVAGGTGVAPMVQLIRTILSDPEERTRLSLVFANRHEEDILLREELDAYARGHPERFRVRYVLSAPPTSGDGSAWTGGRGWVTADDCRQHLPWSVACGSDGRGSGLGGVMIMVCGRDEFLDTVSGRTIRGPPPPGKKQGPKLQGELTGVLREAGFEASQVYKF